MYVGNVCLQGVRCEIVELKICWKENDKKEKCLERSKCLSYYFHV
jgi:hypothetical protein